MSNSQLYLNSTVFLFAILILISPVSTHCPAPSLHGFIISGNSSFIQVRSLLLSTTVRCPSERAKIIFVTIIAYHINYQDLLK